MKTKLILAAALTTGVLFSCANDERVIESGEQEASVPKKVNKEETTSVEEQKTEVVSEESESEVQSRYAYDKDWEMIKEALIAKDAEKLQDWISGDLKAEHVIDVLFGEDIINAIKKTKYEDLKTEDYGGESYLAFVYEESDIDEEGNEVGMAIFIYLEQGDPSLKIKQYLAAG